MFFFPLFYCAAATVEDSLSIQNGKLFSTWDRFPADGGNYTLMKFVLLTQILTASILIL